MCIPSLIHAHSIFELYELQEKRFAFDQAFDAETGNQRLFEATTQPLIGSWTGSRMRGLRAQYDVIPCDTDMCRRCFLTVLSLEKFRYSSKS